MTLGYEEIPPDSESLLESQRAYGYPAEAAIADIVDNCITADSKNIDIYFGWNKENSFLFIANDGKEMDENQLTQAMRLGAKNPKDKRNIGDLGRWGMGLKTASLSQAKKITIFSLNNTKKKYISRCWDLDFIAKEANGRWFLINTLDENSFKLIKNKFKYKAGTVILWENLDRMLDLTDPKKQNFTKLQEKTINHLQLVFHRFLDKDHPKKVNISLNGKKLKPFDPFLESEKATQTSPLKTINDKIKVKGFVLPHVDKFENNDKYEAAGGPKGWNEQQGFYVYREDRLIVGGSWLNLGTGHSEWKKDIHFKLARIKIDLDNSLDEEWKIDVMKVSCEVPARHMNDLKEYAKTIRAKAEEVFRNRARGGRRPIKPSLNDSIWKQKKGIKLL